MPGNAYLRPAAALVGSALIQDKAPRPKDSETSANRLPPARSPIHSTRLGSQDLDPRPGSDFSFHALASNPSRTHSYGEPAPPPKLGLPFSVADKES